MSNTKGFTTLTKELRQAIINNGQGEYRRKYYDFLTALEEKIKFYSGLQESQYMTILVDTILVVKKKIVLGEYEEKGHFMSYCCKVAYLMRLKEERRIAIYRQRYSSIESIQMENYTTVVLEPPTRYDTKIEILQKALSILSATERELLTAYYVQEATSIELAERYQTTPTNIRQRIYSIKQRLIKYSKSTKMRIKAA